MADPTAQDLTGRTLLDRYELGEQIAAGGMSAVYAGKDLRLQRQVCVKVLVGIAAASEYRTTIYEHFVQEAFALSQLQHPNTLRIYDFGHLDEETKTPFIVSELISGGTLLQLVKRSGPLSAEVALEMVEPIVHALAEAHARGIIHRDIKPSNILFAQVGAQRIPKLADFGIAKMRSGPGKAADTKGTSGPPIAFYSAGWAAPEQMRSKPVGPSADVFSLGLLLAFALTGKKVFPDDDNVVRTLAHRIEGDEFVETSLEKMQLPPTLREVITRACRTDPPERYQTALDFLRAAQEAIRAPAEPAPPPPVPPLPPRSAPEPRTVLRVANVSEPQILAAGRRVALVPSGGAVDLGGEGSPVPSPARARFTFVPGPKQTLRLHVKGLNCFVAKEGGRPTSAVEVAKDTVLRFQVPARVLDSVHCQFARTGDPTAFQFPVANVTLAVPLEQAACAVLLDFGPGRDLALVYSRPR